MKLKQLLFCAAMLFTTQVFAQQFGPAAIVNDKDIPVEAQQTALAGQLIRYGYQTKSALPLIQAIQIYKSLNIKEATGREPKQSQGTEKATSVAKSDYVSFDEAKILSDATTFADGNKNILALIKDTEKTTRGAVPGPVRQVDRVRAGYTDTWPIKFRGG